jgi:hypothetical protein
MAELQGSVLAIFLYDVCEEIRLEQLRDLLPAQRPRPAFKHPAADQVRVEQPPVLEALPPLQLNGGGYVEAQAKYYDYGVISIIFQRAFRLGWDELVQLSSALFSDTLLEQHASRIVREKLERVTPAVRKPYADWLTEDYYIFLLNDVDGNPPAVRLLAERGNVNAKVVRGETA